MLRNMQGLQANNLLQPSAAPALGDQLRGFKWDLS